MSIKNIIRKTGPIYNRLVALNYGRVISMHRKAFEKEGLEGVKKVITASMNELVGYSPNFDNPTTFNDKIQWLKLYWYDERLIQCCDKNMVRNYVKEKGLQHILVPQIAVYKNADEIDLANLPEKFVLKPSHDSGHTYICTDKHTFKVKKVKKELSKWLGYDYAFRGMEWSYHNNHPTIVCEELLEPDKESGELYDYKFFCFSGEPKYIFFVSDRQNEAKSDFYDLEWKLQDFRWYYEPSGKIHKKPDCFEKMIEYARILSSDFPFVRVDFYESNGKVFFGELTFFHGSGYGWFRPETWDKTFGSMIELPEKSSINPWDWVRIRG